MDSVFEAGAFTYQEDSGPCEFSQVTFMFGEEIDTVVHIRGEEFGDAEGVMSVSFDNSDQESAGMEGVKKDGYVPQVFNKVNEPVPAT